MFRFPTGRQLFDAASFGRPFRAASFGASRIPACSPLRCDACRDRRGRCGQPRDRDAMSRRSSHQSHARATERPARGRGLIDTLASRDGLMNLRTNPPLIPFIDVAAQRRRLGIAVDAAVARVLSHCQFVLGPEVRAFETELATFCGAKHVITCASGTDALVLVLRALGVGPGDAVLCPSFTFCATAEVAALVGATPVFVDVDARTFNIDVKGIAGAVETARQAGLNPKAIIPVDLFGLPADHAAIRSAAAADNLLVLDDAAQSFGATC